MVWITHLLDFVEVVAEASALVPGFLAQGIWGLVEDIRWASLVVVGLTHPVEALGADCERPEGRTLDPTHQAILQILRNYTGACVEDGGSEVGSVDDVWVAEVLVRVFDGPGVLGNAEEEAEVALVHVEICVWEDLLVVNVPMCASLIFNSLTVIGMNLSETSV